MGALSLSAHSRALLWKGRRHATTRRRGGNIMQQPTTKTSVSKCVALGRYAAAMLGKLTNKPALLSFAASMTAAIDSLEASQGAWSKPIAFGDEMVSPDRGLGVQEPGPVLVFDRPNPAAPVAPHARIGTVRVVVAAPPPALPRFDVLHAHLRRRRRARQQSVGLVEQAERAHEAEIRAEAFPVARVPGRAACRLRTMSSSDPPREGLNPRGEQLHIPPAHGPPDR